MTVVNIGDLVRVKNTTTGDSAWTVRLFRDKTPLLLTGFDCFADKTYAEILDIDGHRKWIKTRRLELVQ